MAESFAHGLDKWYLLICSPLLDGKVDYSGKISHLINEISSYQTNYPAVYSPLNTIQYFNQQSTLTQEDFKIELQRRTYEQTSLDKLTEAIRSRSDTKITHARIVDDYHKANPSYPITLRRFMDDGSTTELTEGELRIIIDEVVNYIDRLRELPIRSRDFLALLVQRAKPRSSGLFSDLIVLATEAMRAANIDKRTLFEELEVLEGHKFTGIYEDSDGRLIIYLEGINNDWSLWPGLKDHCKRHNLDLREFIVDLQFHLLD